MIRDHIFFFLSLRLGRGRDSQSTALRYRSAIRMQANGRGAERGWGGGSQVHQPFGDKRSAIIEELNETLAA